MYLPKENQNATIANQADLQPQISLKANYLFNATLTISNILFPLITFAYIARIFGPEVLGKINFVVSLASYFALIASFALPIYGTSTIAKYRNDPKGRSILFSEFFGITLVSSIISTIFYLFLLFFIPQLQRDIPLFLIYGSNILFSFLSVDWLFQGCEKYKYISLRNILAKILIVFAIILLIKNSHDYLLFGLISTGIGLAVNIHGIVKAQNLISISIIFSGFKKHYKALIINSSSLITVCIYVILDNVILGLLAGNVYVGYYSTAIKIVRIVTAVTTSLAIVLLPRLSYYIESNQMDAFNALAKKSLNFIYMISFPATIAIIILAPEIISLLAGNKFTEAILPLRIGALIIPFVGLTNLIGIQILIPLGKLKQQFFSTFIAALCSIILYIALIPSKMHVGAAIATTAAEIIVLFVQLTFIKKGIINFNLFDKKALQYLISSLFMGLILYFISHIFITSLFINLGVSIFLGALLYFSILLFLIKDPLCIEIKNWAFLKLHIPT